MKNTFLFVALGCAAGVLTAQSGRVAGPMVGYVFDASVRSLRPIVGIPGASTMGDPINIGFVLSNAAVAPRQDAAVGFGSDGSVHLLRLSSGTAAETRCAACPGSAEAAVFSPSGAAVALLSDGRVQIVTGLPDAPAAGAAFEVGSLRRSAGGHPQVPPMALSDDGLWLLVGTSTAADLFHANGGVSHLMSTQPYPLVAFAAGTHDAVVADAQGAGTVLFHDVAGSGASQQIAPANAFRKPGGLILAADGATVFVALPGEGNVASFTVATGTRTDTACNCTLSGLVQMGSVLRVNETGNGPLWLLDSTAAPPRLLFVPAAVAAQ